MDHPIDLPPLPIPALLKQHGIKPDQHLGQNFLVDDQFLQKITQAAHLTPSDCVLEIGAGIGNLTRYLAARAGRVAAVEIDPRLLPILRQVTAPFTNVKIIQGDILALEPGSLFGEALATQGYVVVANIPYYITSAVFRHLLEASHPPRSLFLTVQREVAQRICAGPGEMSLLALSVQVYGKPEILFHIPAGAFYPPPEVDSSLVQVQLYPAPRLPKAHLESFFRLIKAGFAQKRKKLRNALASGLGWSALQVEAFLLQASIEPARRAETLSLEEWAALAARLADEAAHQG